MTDIMDRIEKILLENGIEFEHIWEETCGDGWYYLQCNVRKKEAEQNGEKETIPTNVQA